MDQFEDKIENIINRINYILKIISNMTYQIEINLKLSKKIYNEIFIDEVDKELNNISLKDLSNSIDGNQKINVLINNGYHNAKDILNTNITKLNNIKGISENSINKLRLEANNRKEILKQNLQIRFNPDYKNPDKTKFLKSIITNDQMVKFINDNKEQNDKYLKKIKPLLNLAQRKNGFIKKFFTKKERSDESIEARNKLYQEIDSQFLLNIEKHINNINNIDNFTELEIWEYYEKNAAYYNSLITKIINRKIESTEKIGYFTSEQSTNIENHNINLNEMKSSLRVYQLFGSKFAVKYKKVIIGDAMGLGKTLQGLAVISHHYYQDKSSKFLIVCPLSIIENWIREVEKHTNVPVNSLYNVYDKDRFKKWEETGGVGIINYEKLNSIPEHLKIQCKQLIIDEAHYIKNPDAKRSKLSAELINLAENALLLTGTPIENKLNELKNLISYLDPSIHKKIINIHSSYMIHEKIAPLYLRREQHEVLKELPEKEEKYEWVTPDLDSMSSYINSLKMRNFMAARRSFLINKNSSKLKRIIEIVDEAEQDNKKVIIFSNFIDTLDVINNEFKEKIAGVIKGGVPAGQRQQIIDDFTKKKELTVLLAQISTGGVGLNIQAASIIIITEPQYKPSTENQAIARAYRMGQIRTVRVHRLIAVGCIDEKIIKLLNNKTKIFEEYAMKSNTKDNNIESTNDSYINDSSLENIMNEEIKRLNI